MFGCARCYMAATRMGTRLCYVGHSRFREVDDAQEKPRALLALAQLDLSIQSPHRGTLRISPLLRMTPRKSYHDFALDGMHAIKNIMSAIFAALCGQVMKPPRQPAGMDFTLDASVGTSRAMTSRRSAYLINTGTLQTSGADSTPRHTF